MSEKELAKKWYDIGHEDGYCVNTDDDKGFSFHWKDREISVSRTCDTCNLKTNKPCYVNRTWNNGICSEWGAKEKEDCAEKFYNKVNFETNQNASDTEEDDD